jgi:hypothetical protein
VLDIGRRVLDIGRRVLDIGGIRHVVRVRGLAGVLDRVSGLFRVQRDDLLVCRHAGVDDRLFLRVELRVIGRVGRKHGPRAHSRE